MFTYGLDQFINLLMWEREREIRGMSRVPLSYGLRARWISLRATVEDWIVQTWRLFTRLSHRPHIRG